MPCKRCSRPLAICPRRSEVCNSPGSLFILRVCCAVLLATGTTMPTVVDSAFAASYVSAISVANMAGRFGWATASDYVGSWSWRCGDAFWPSTQLVGYV